MLRWFAFTFVFLASPSLLRAQNSLESLKDFREQITLNWRYECKNEELLRADPLINSKSQVEIPRILFEGLKRIREINSEIIDQSLKTIAGKELKFKCIENEREFLSRYSEYSKGTIKLSVTFAGFLTPPAQIYDRTFDHEQMSRIRQDGANILVHEFLHALNLDNLKLSTHLDGRRPSREDDVVFACAAQAYPWDPVLTDAPSCFPGCTGHWPDYANTNQACVTCGGARLQNGKVQVETPSADVKAKCQNIRKENFRF